VSSRFALYRPNTIGPFTTGAGGSRNVPVVTPTAVIAISNARIISKANAGVESGRPNDRAVVVIG